MAAFVATSAYADWCAASGHPLTVAQLAAADLDLEVACDDIRDYICQTVDLVTGDVITLAGTGTRALILPELPVSAATITSAGVAVTDFTRDAYGILWRTDPSIWSRGVNYTVTYTHGYALADVPAWLRRAAFQLAQNVSSGGNVSSTTTTVGPFTSSETFEGGAASEVVLASLDRRIVKRIPVP